MAAGWTGSEGEGGREMQVEGGPGGGWVRIRVARWEELVALRRVVLRTGLPIGEAMIAEDDLATTLHVGAFVQKGGEEVNVGCGTYVLGRFSARRAGAEEGVAREEVEQFNLARLEGREAYRLRQMAIDADYRRGGVGRGIMELGEQLIGERTGVGLLWCDARLPAIRFYERLGWQVVSGLYYVPTAGPHYRMVKELG